MKQETHLPNSDMGELKLDSTQLEINERYWVMLTAHNEKLTSRVAKVDFEPLDPAGKKEDIFLHQNFCVFTPIFCYPKIFAFLRQFFVTPKFLHFLYQFFLHQKFYFF